MFCILFDGSLFDKVMLGKILTNEKLVNVINKLLLVENKVLYSKYYKRWLFAMASTKKVIDSLFTFMLLYSREF